MRIFQISAAYPPSPGGVATHVANLSHGLMKIGDNTISVLTCSESENKNIYPKLEKGKLQVWKLGLKNIPTFYSRRTPLEDAIFLCMNEWHKINAELIHVHDFDSAYIGVMLKIAFNVPIVFTLHRAPSPWKEEKYKENPKDCFLETLKMFDLVNKIIVPSNKSKRILLDQGFNEEKIIVIKHGVHYKYLSSFSDIDAIKDEFESKLIILCPIRADEHKSPEVFIHAASIVKENNPDKNILFLITDKPEARYKYLPKLASTLKLKKDVDIIFRRFERHEMPTLYRLSKICVVPSLRESFGQTVIESFVFKTPVIVANSSALKEIIRHNTNGLKFTPNSPLDLSKQIQRLIDSEGLCDHLISNGLKDVQDKYDADRMVKEYYSLYRSIIGRH